MVRYGRGSRSGQIQQTTTEEKSGPGTDRGVYSWWLFPFGPEERNAKEKAESRDESLIKQFCANGHWSLALRQSRQQAGRAMREDPVTSDTGGGMKIWEERRSAKGWRMIKSFQLDVDDSDRWEMEGSRAL